ncbi:MAG: HAD-IC family P-type ATPase [Methanobacterium sp.]|nr:HAD-IC family P-type ATPase [Methanobacterium sp.]
MTNPRSSDTESKKEAWYTLSKDDASKKLGVSPKDGLNSTEAAKRLKSYGPNILEEEKEKPGWRKWLEQYKAYMQIVLVIAAIVSLFIAEYRTFLLLLLLTVFIANLGYRQEAKASRSVAALNKMMKVVAKVRRDGQITQIEAENIVPGDIVILDAGDRVPADGRVLIASNLQIEEAALTGESMAVDKNSDVNIEQDTPIGDRVNMAFMNTSVTRGHGEILITQTGMSSEVGHIATMLKEHKAEKTPLMQQIDRVTLFIIGMAVLAFLAIVIIGLSQGGSFKDLFNIGISLAIGSIPDALPAVVTTILAMGMMAMAKKNAIIKNMPAVETLGSTSAINSDKTGTLTMNQMTVKVISTILHRYTVSGEGYSFEGKIQRIEGMPEENLDYIYFPCALCIDTDIKDGEVIGDPTEAALYVLAEKGGVNVREFRKNNPRIASIPFDSDYKFMATFHAMKTDTGKPVIRAYVKGAPDVILERSIYGLMSDASVRDLSTDDRQKIEDENESIASEGLRVLALAQKDINPESFDPKEDLMQHMHNLMMTALIGEVDPPRAEAKEAIKKAKIAGVQVRMITGDHAVTAEAIGRELGIDGKTITGAEFAALSDEEAENEIDQIGVLARVAPEHKVRLVKTLKKKGNIVAMTGDGVNDAPSIKTADIGIAMGITGSDVAKGAAKMILVDDNFATIVTAIEEGRKIYDNLQKFLRIQIANMFMFILAFLGASIFSLIGTALYTPGQVLWVHMLVVAPIGIMFGLDMASPGIMNRKPRKHDEGIISKGMYVRLFIVGIFMATTSLLVYHIGHVSYGSLEVGQTMGLVSISLMNIFLALNLRFPKDTAFQSATYSNIRLLYAYLWIILGTMLITETRLFNELFGTVSLDAYQWGICLLPGIFLLIIGEMFKRYLRYKDNKTLITPG